MYRTRHGLFQLLGEGGRTSSYVVITLILVLLVLLVLLILGFRGPSRSWYEEIGYDADVDDANADGDDEDR